MKNEILEIGNALTKAEQKRVHGGDLLGDGRFGLIDNCFSINDPFRCDQTDGCAWLGCNCGPNYIHMADPCT